MTDMDGSDDDGDSADPLEERQFQAAGTDHGQRLDRVLAAHVAEFSRSYLQQLVAGGAARVNGAVTLRSAHKLQVGDHVAITLLPTPESRAFRPQSMPLVVLHEDDDLLVIDKPAGLVVHPAPGHWGGTLLNGLLARDERAAGLPRAGIVHRLDKDTSGVLVVARSLRAVERLRAAFAARRVHREYVALAHGTWRGPPERDITGAIGRDPHRRVRMAVLDPAVHPAKSARTTVRLLHNGAATCLVRCRLHTGRTHQIRVHLAHVGHPLLADALYGGAPALGMARQALHARRLALAHPVSGEPLEFLAPVPADLRAALAAGGFTMDLLAGPGPASLPSSRSTAQDEPDAGP